VAGVNPGCSFCDFNSYVAPATGLASVWTSSVSCEVPSQLPNHLVGVGAGVCLLRLEVLLSLSVKLEREELRGFDSKTT